jgi:large subunit ribosomal protein L2
MPIKNFHPQLRAAASMTVVSREDITKQTPEKSLVEGQEAKTAAATARARHFALHRRRAQAGLPRDRFQARQVRDSGVVAAIEYDPNRSARIALLNYADGEKRYILRRTG